MTQADSAAQAANNFLYLNREKRWADFSLGGLTIDADGGVRLTALPVGGATNVAAPSQTNSDEIGDVASTPDGTIFFSDPTRGRVLRLDGCELDAPPAVFVPCGGRRSDSGGQPRALLWHHGRDALFVADSHRRLVQVFDPQTGQRIDQWDGTGADAAKPSQGFGAPTDLAADSAGAVYVLDYRARRIVKFGARGNVLPAFWENVVAGSKRPVRPVHIATSPAMPSTSLSSTEVFVLDARYGSPPSPEIGIWVFDADGRYLRDAPLDLRRPGPIEVDQDRIYVADNETGRLVVYPRAFNQGRLDPIGQAAAFAGPVAALRRTTDGSGDLLISPGDGAAPIRLKPAGAFVRQGWMIGGPFPNPSLRPEPWHRLRLFTDPLPAGTHLRLFVRTTPPPPGGPTAPPFDAPGWLTPTDGAAELLFAGAPEQNVWVGVEMTGEGTASPVLRQMRLEFDHSSYIDQLPAVFSKDEAGRATLVRLLSLLDGAFKDVEDRIARLPALFDSAVSPSEFLAWLSGWLALEPRDNWDEAKRRSAIAGAYALYERRGTPRGLRDALKFFLDVDAVIEEPILHADVWTLGSDDDAAGCASCGGGGAPASLPAGTAPLRLGVSTVLALAEPSGAVLGSATLGQSQVVPDDEYSAPLFSRLADRVTIRLYRGGAAGRIEAVRALVDAEKPAHVLSQVCLIEPMFRVGFQARIGIDAIVAAPPGVRQPTRLGAAGGPEGGLVLGGASPTIGETARVGMTFKLPEG